MPSNLAFTFIVLCGKTGSGKTLLLQQLEFAGYPVLNLEKIANHRGSAFGGFLLPSQPSQKNFEAALKETLLQYKSSTYIFVEQKASSLGKTKIPLWLHEETEKGIFVLLDVRAKQRVQNILHIYQEAGREKFITALHKLKDRLPAPVIKQCEDFISKEDYKAFVTVMLNYYDNTSIYNANKQADIIISTQTNEPLYMMHELLHALKQKGIITS